MFLRSQRRQCRILKMSGIESNKRGEAKIRMARRDDVNYFKKLNAEKRALDDVWNFSDDHRTVTFWNKTDEFIELVGSFTSVLGSSSSIQCTSKVCLWPRTSYNWRFMGTYIICFWQIKTISLIFFEQQQLLI